MEAFFLWSGIALSAFALWAIARNDWLRLTRPRMRVIARVKGHRESWENASKSYAAIYAFTAEGGPCEVEDAVHSSYRQPEVGTTRELVYPQGRPDLARPPRPAMWLGIYGLLSFMLLLLLARLMGLID